MGFESQGIMEQDFMGLSLRTVKVKKEVPEETTEPGILFDLCLSFNPLPSNDFAVCNSEYISFERKENRIPAEKNAYKCSKESTLKKAHNKNFMLFCQETKIVHGFSRFSYVLVYFCIMQYF